MASIVENKNVIGEKTDEDNNNDDSNNNINEIQRQEPREFIDKLQKEEGKLSHEIKEELEKQYPAEKGSEWCEQMPYWMRGVQRSNVYSGYHIVHTMQVWRKAILDPARENNMFGPIVQIDSNFPVIIRNFTNGINGDKVEIPKGGYDIGKYNERRRNMYETDLFKKEENKIDGFDGVRDVHMGIDIGAPVNTPIYSFCDCKILHFGYNPAKGDYGNVIITVQEIPNPYENEEEDFKSLYSLYGHLSGKSIEGKSIGQEIKKGEIIGWMGDRNENGDWPSHVHFQLSVNRPETHDMPGVVSVNDIAKALASYPDPRLVLGDVYRGNGSGIGGMWQTGDLNDVDNFDYSLKNDLNYMMPESRFFQLKQLD